MTQKFRTDASHVLRVSENSDNAMYDFVEDHLKNIVI